MKRFLLPLILLAIAGAAHAQLLPYPPSLPGAAGTFGQVQYNNGGSLGGFTLGGDATLVTSTGALTVNKIQGTTINSVPASGILVGTTDAQTLTNKALNGTLGATTPAAITGTTVTANTSVTTPSVTTALGATPLLLQTGGATRAQLDVGTGFNRLVLGAVGDQAGRLRLEGNVASNGYDISRDNGTGYLLFKGEQTTFSGYIFQDNNGTEIVRFANGGNATFAGSVSTSTVTTASGDLTLSANSNNVVTNNALLEARNTSSASVGLQATSLGADLKRWQWNMNSTGITLNAWNDNLSGVTNAYVVARGTTYNVASHTWYTSTVAGSAVQGLQLTTTALTSAVPVTVPGAANPLLTTSAAITTGAGASTGTLTNAPAAGNPTKWFPINDNGTTRYVPAW